MKWLNHFIILVIAVIMLPDYLLAEDITEEWVTRYDNGSTDWAKAIAADSSGNVYVAGQSIGSSGYSDLVTIKYDRNGNEAWVKRYACRFGGSANAIAADSSGNIYVTGGCGGLGYYVTIKYDTIGNELWIRKYTGVYLYYAGANAIVIDSTDNVYVTGSIGPYYTTVKYDTNGNELWSRQHGDYCYGTCYQSYVYAIALDASNNVYITGTKYFVSSGRDYLTVKYDTDGNELWSRQYDSGGVYEEAHAIAVDSLGGVYVTGMTSTVTGSDFLTIKYDVNGSELWVKRYDRSFVDIARNLAVDSLGNVVLSGYSGGDYVTVKYDANGNELWIKRYDGGYWEVALDLALDSSDNIYVTGGGGGPYYATVKYDTNGNDLWVVKSYVSNAYYNTAYAIAIVLDSLDNVYVTGPGAGYDFVTVKYRQGSDITPPTISIASPAESDYAISESLTIDFTVTDSSGVKSYTSAIDDKNVVNGQVVNIYEFGAGAHTFTVSAEDTAGNTAVKTVSFNVIVTTESLADLIQLFLNMGLIDNSGVATAMIQMLNNNAGGALVNYIDAQDGKHISSEAADILRNAIGSL